jgi:hypothetical protein
MRLHTRFLSSAGLLVLGLSGASTLHAQQFLGDWEDQAGSVATIELYVSPTGSDTTGTGSPGNPWRTVSFAAGVARTFLADPLLPVTPNDPVPAPVTINVEPGLYDTVIAGEVFPIRAPAHGLTIETWRPTGAAAPFDRPNLMGAGIPTFTLILVDYVGDQSLPASTFQTLELSDAREGIAIDPGINSPPPGEPFGVQVRQNYFHDLLTIALRIQTDPHFCTRHIIEDNDFGDLLGEVRILGWAVREASQGIATTLYRSNRIQNYEEGLEVLAGFGIGGIARPRIFSNFVQLAERSITLRECDSFVINNTVAFASDYTAAPSLDGVRFFGGTFVLSNNILWCPLDPSSPAIPAVDLQILGGAVGTMVTNTSEDVPTDPAPLFVGGDAHPDAIPSVPVDLHLSRISPMIAAGTNAEALDPIVTIRSIFAGPMVVRTDITTDIDLGGRIHRSGLAVEAGLLPLVEIGADEVQYVSEDDDGIAFDSRIEFPVTATQDRFGHVIAQPATTFLWLLDLDLSGPPGGVFGMVIGFDFLDTVLDPTLGVLTENGPVYQNAFLGALSLGNLLIDLSPTSSASAFAGIFDPAGTATIVGVPLAVGGAGLAEAEWYFQMVAFDLAGRGALSNRPKIELDVP